MADERRKSMTTGAFPRVDQSGRVATARATRAQVVVPVRYRFGSIIDFAETQSVNISRTGMFVLTGEVAPVGTLLDFEVGLADGYRLLRGKAEVVRASQNPAGMGLRFVELDPPSEKLIARIVEVNVEEGKTPTVPMDFDGGPGAGRGGFGAASSSQPGGVAWGEQELTIQLNTASVSYFVYNPLLNIRLGGFVVPAERDIPLGTVLSVSIGSMSGENLFTGKGKVVAKHERRVGVRLTDVEKSVLARLQAEVSRLVP